jgi:acyl-coenzyme A thioesterase PaaI-like protein
MDGYSEKNSTDSRLPQFSHCFVCGSENQRGLKIKFCLCDEGVEAVFTPDVTHAGYENVVHGGILSALLDEAVSRPN